ncbi:MAG TPA: hypothetical protein VN775_08475 [Opitutaceae bacterium]|nr:hypothetical protein [Opitutaceae bacterium]
MSLPARIPRLLRPRLWWWFPAAIALHLIAWSAWLAIAARHPVASVPLAAHSRR